MSDDAVEQSSTSPHSQVHEDAEDAFAAVADETRVRMLRELWGADGPLSFSELRDRAGVRDSGRFNYHLGKLRGRFVEKGEDGYDLRYAGLRLVGALHSGAYTAHETVEPVPVDGTCPDCEGDLEAAYEDEAGRVTCTDCGLHVLYSELPAGFVEGREHGLPGALDDYLRTMVRQSADGFCFLCLGRTTGRLERTDRGPRAVFECERCGAPLNADLSAAVLDHPEVAAFYRDHGRDVRETRLWELDWECADAGATESGRRATVTVELDGDELRFTLNDSLDVVATERE